MSGLFDIKNLMCTRKTIGVKLKRQKEDCQYRFGRHIQLLQIVVAE